MTCGRSLRATESRLPRLILRTASHHVWRTSLRSLLRPPNQSHRSRRALLWELDRPARLGTRRNGGAHDDSAEETLLLPRIPGGSGSLAGSDSLFWFSGRPVRGGRAPRSLPITDGPAGRRSSKRLSWTFAPPPDRKSEPGNHRPGGRTWRGCIGGTQRHRCLRPEDSHHLWRTRPHAVGLPPRRDAAREP